MDSYDIWDQRKQSLEKVAKDNKSEKKYAPPKKYSYIFLFCKYVSCFVVQLNGYVNFLQI
jgi:hypothetical protein